MTTNLSTGTRIRLIEMTNDPAPIATGATGTVRGVREVGSGRERWLQIDVEWDNGRNLMLSCPPDRFEIIL